MTAALCRHKVEQWLNDPWYSDLVKYIRYGERIHEDRLLAASHVKVTKARAARYRMVEAFEGIPPRLLFRERNDKYSSCVHTSEVARILYLTHDMHGHFLEAITIKRCGGKYY